MDSKNLSERSSYQLRSLASRIKAIHHAYDRRRACAFVEGLTIDDPSSCKTRNHSFLSGRLVRKVRPGKYQQVVSGDGSEKDV
jgi:hypothetical protein